MEAKAFWSLETKLNYIPLLHSLSLSSDPQTTCCFARFNLSVLSPSMYNRCMVDTCLLLLSNGFLFFKVLDKNYCVYYLARYWYCFSCLLCDEFYLNLNFNLAKKLKKIMQSQTWNFLWMQVLIFELMLLNSCWRWTLIALNLFPS